MSFGIVGSWAVESMGSRENKQNKVRTQLWDTLYTTLSLIRIKYFSNRYVLAVGTFVTIIERKYCEVLLMMTTDQRRMWMIYLTMAASLIMTDSANNGSSGAVCAQERDEIPSITCSRCRHNPIAAYTRHSVLH